MNKYNYSYPKGNNKMIYRRVEMNMKKGKLVKLMSLISISALSMGVLAGCGGNTQTSAEVNTQSTEAASPEASPEAAADTTNQADNVIVMGTNAEFEPFEYRENGTEITGFDVELAQKVAEKLGKELVIEDMAFDSLILALNSDKIDFIAAGMTVTEEKKTQVDFSDSYFTSNQVIIVKADNNDINTVEDLKGKNVGVQLGTTGDIAVSSNGDITVTQFPTGTAAVLDLKNGQVDAVVIDSEPAKKMTEGQSDLKIVEAPFVQEEYAMAVKKGDSELLNAINETLAEVKADGTYDAIYNKYIQSAK